MFETAERDLRGTNSKTAEHAGMTFAKESITKQVSAEIDTEKNRGTRATVYRFDKNGKIIHVGKV